MTGRWSLVRLTVQLAAGEEAAFIGVGWVRLQLHNKITAELQDSL